MDAPNKREIERAVAINIVQKLLLPKAGNEYNRELTYAVSVMRNYVLNLYLGFGGLIRQFLGI